MSNVTGAYLKGGTGTLNVWCNGDMLCVAPDHINYSKILEKVVAGDFDGIEPMLNIAKGIEEYTFGKIVIRGGQLFYGEHEIQNTLVDRILANMKDGTCFKRYVSFLDKLLENPSSRSLDQLYDFLKYTCLRIADDGFVYAYKGITPDWKDRWTKSIDNSVGALVKMPRNLISDDPDVACHKGLHCGTIKYAYEYGNGERMVIVRVHPKDVVSVPKDCTYQKCRVCEYVVVAECDSYGNPINTNWKFSNAGADDVIENMHVGYGFTNSTDNDDSYEPSEVTSNRVYDDSPSKPYMPDSCEDRDEDWDYDSDHDEDEECCEECGDCLSDCCCQDEDDDSDEYCECGCYLNADGTCDECDGDDEDDICGGCGKPCEDTVCDSCVKNEEEREEPHFCEECKGYAENYPICNACTDKMVAEDPSLLHPPAPIQPVQFPVPHQPQKRWWQIW